MILTSAMPRFQQCVNIEHGDVQIDLQFKLFSAKAPFLVRPHKVAVDPKTNRDEIVVKLKDVKASRAQEVACIKNVIRGLDFQPVNPAYEYMETHEYSMRIPAMIGQNG